ncbi:MAG TPA: YjgP/YjgQ family permease [Planctomycetes bacterium]|nr:YjgP/YjgQ family permease [Planctomycetota bacterium]HIK61578.1 YjgP/YjgQ family permease [Planctomycetota bacterium]
MKLQLYILRQLVSACAFSVGGLMVVALPGIAVTTVHKMPHADIMVLLKLLPLTLQTLVPYVLPMCFLLACVATYGRLAADREWTAIQMSGTRPLNMLLPAAAVASVMALGTFWMVSTQSPQMKERLRELRVQAVASSIGNLGPGRTHMKLGEVLVEALWHDPDTGLLHDVYVREPEHQGRPKRDYHAQTASMRVNNGLLTVEMTDLLSVDPEDGSTVMFEWIGFDYQLKDQGYVPSIRPKFLKSGEIRRLLDAGEVPSGMRDRYRFEIHYRYVLSATYFVFMLLGVATGLILRKGTQLGALAVSSGYGLLHYMLNMRLAKDLGIDGILSPVVGAWTPTMLGLLIAVPFVHRALKR